MKKYLSILFLLPALGLLAQNPTTAAPAAANPEKLYDVLHLVLLIGAAVIFLTVLGFMLRVNQFMYRQILQNQAAVSGRPISDYLPVPPIATESYGSRWKKKYWENAAPLEREADILMHHDYDGIRELDNHLPPFWLNMFYATIIFAVVYMYIYHFGGGGETQIQTYDKEVAEGKRQRAVAMASLADQVNETNVAALTDAGALTEGKAIYMANCLACHGAGGEGTVGPNFTDEYWIHGGGIKNMFKTITYGVPDKGMISWSAQLRPSDIQKVGSYILTLRSTNPPNPKAPQGDIWKEEVK